MSATETAVFDGPEVYRLFEIAREKAALGVPNDLELRATMIAAGVDLRDNKNSFVPWTDPNIDYECACGARIYADQVHVH